MKKVVSAVITVLLLALSVVPAFAVESPVAPANEYKITIITTEGGNASYEFTSEIDENGNQSVHLTSLPNEGYAFDHWVIDGSYTTEDALTKSEIDIIISSDITVTPYYSKDGTTVTDPPTTIKTDTGSTSPKTGYDNNFPYAVIFLAAAACGFAALTLKLVKSK